MARLADLKNDEAIIRYRGGKAPRYRTQKFVDINFFRLIFADETSETEDKVVRYKRPPYTPA